MMKTMVSPWGDLEQIKYWILGGGEGFNFRFFQGLSNFLREGYSIFFCIYLIIVLKAKLDNHYTQVFRPTIDAKRFVKLKSSNSILNLSSFPKICIQEEKGEKLEEYSTTFSIY